MSDLIVIESVNALQVFVANGLDPIIEKIERQVKAEDLDISTEAGRKRVASLAYKVAQSKTALDALGKKLTEDWKAKSKAVDVERKRAWDKLEALQKDIRKPLTEWEDAEKARTEKHEADIAELNEAARVTAEAWQTLPLQAMRDRLQEIEVDGNKDWQEFAARGKHAVETALTSIKTAIAKRETYDAEQAELTRLRQENAAREQREREERIAAEAAAKAVAAAEAKAQALAAEAAVREGAIRREKEVAEERAIKAEQEKQAAEEKAERDRLEAMEQAKRQAAAAAKAERDRLEAEKQAQAQATAKREADKKHRAKINNEVLQVLKNVVEEDKAKAVIETIARGLVPHVTIAY